MVTESVFVVKTGSAKPKTGKGHGFFDLPLFDVTKQRSDVGDEVINLVSLRG